MLDAIPFGTLRDSEVVEQPGADRCERKLLDAEEDVAELPRLGIAECQIVFKELGLPKEAWRQRSERALDIRPAAIACLSLTGGPIVMQIGSSSGHDGFGPYDGEHVSSDGLAPRDEAALSSRTSEINQSPAPHVKCRAVYDRPVTPNVAERTIYAVHPVRGVCGVHRVTTRARTGSRPPGVGRPLVAAFGRGSFQDVSDEPRI